MTVMIRLVHRISSIRQDPHRLRYMRERLREAADVLDYSRGKWPSVYHLALLEMAHRVKEDKRLLSELSYVPEFPN